MTTTVRAAPVRNILITRSKEGNEELAASLKLAGYNPVSVDAISLSPPKDWSIIDGFLRRLHSFDWLAFTSVTGAEYFGGRMKSLSFELPWQGKPLVAAVGGRTAERLSGFGINPDFIPSAYLTKKLGEELPVEDGTRVLLLRADIADPELSERLRARGCEVQEGAIYRTQLAGRATGKKLGDVDLIVFASPSAVRGFCMSVPKEEVTRLQSVRAICIGPVTEAVAKENGFAMTIVPRSYTLNAVVDEIGRLSRRDA